MIELSNDPFERAQMKRLRNVETDIREIGRTILMSPQAVTAETAITLGELVRERNNIRIALQTK